MTSNTKKKKIIAMSVLKVIRLQYKFLKTRKEYIKFQKLQMMTKKIIKMQKHI